MKTIMGLDYEAIGRPRRHFGFQVPAEAVTPIVIERPVLAVTPPPSPPTPPPAERVTWWQTIFGPLPNPAEEYIRRRLMKGTLVGTGAGAATGGIATRKLRYTGLGALVGAGLGAGVSYLTMSYEDIEKGAAEITEERRAQ